MLKILIAHHYPVLRKGLQAIIGEIFQKTEVDHAECGRETLEKCRNNRYDLVILGLSLPGINGMDLLRKINPDGKDGRTLVLGDHDEELLGLRAIKTGARGYLRKTCCETEMKEAIRRVAAGERYYSRCMMDRLAECASEGAGAGSLESLSDREHQIFMELKAGKTVKEIATELCLDPKTIYSHRERMRRKLGMKSDREFMALVA